MKIIRIIPVAIGLILAFSTATAATPLWTFDPLTATTISVPSNGTATVNYRITNQSKKKHTLVIQPQAGVSQTLPCQLGPKDSINSTCILSLVITGSALPPNGISSGPVLCQANSDSTTPNPNQCYQPSAANRLNITVGSSMPAPITVSGTPLRLLVNGNTGTLTITNTSTTTTALNITSNFTGTALAGKVTETGNTCASVPPGGNCTLTFTPGGVIVPLTSFPIQGNNTNAVNASISISALFGVTGDGSVSQPETLFTLNVNSGNATFVMALGNGDDGESIASDGTGLYHWSGNGNPSIFELINLDTNTTTNIPLSGTDIDSEVFGAVYFNQNGSFLVSRLNGQIYNMTLMGNSTLIGGSFPDDVRGLACFNHRIYGISPFASPVDLYEINPNTGAIISSVPVTLAGFTVQNGNGLTVDPSTGTFYALLKVNGSTPRKLVTVNVTTGVATLIGNADDGTNLVFSTIAFHPADSAC